MHSAWTISSISSVVMPGRMAAAAMSRTSRAYCFGEGESAVRRRREDGTRESETTHPADLAHALDLLGVEHATLLLGAIRRLLLRRCTVFCQRSTRKEDEGESANVELTSRSP